VSKKPEKPRKREKKITEPNPNRKKTEPNRKKTELNQKKPSQTGLNWFFSKKPNRNQQVSVFLFKNLV
jgi:hypothetical protein